MLQRLLLKNFRGFRDHAIPLRSTTIAVGRNNAGKSTIVEAFRLISLVANRAPFLAFTEPPEWLDIPVGFRGVSPSIKGMHFEFRSVCHAYGEPPAVVTGIFSNGTRVSVYLNPEEEAVFAVISDASRRQITNKGQAQKIGLPAIYVLPPVGPLASRERVLAPDYVKSSMDTYLAPSHFRNQLELFRDECYAKFAELAEESWPNLGISSLEVNSDGSDSELSLLVRDGNFVAEVGWMGHGLQTWLQTVWFLSRVPAASTIILDEPDIYLHADLQRKLIRLLKGRYKQVIVATHSV